ncbi:MAG TPA: ABC transporter permease [Acidimicrobiales bacterium]|nr:ABC transporter permease [Acidimicrobiales bacterium]
MNPRSVRAHPRRVPLARRNLTADRRRLAAGVTGVGLAVMLILLLDGMWAGIRQQATLYSERSGADLFVLQPGVRDLTAGAGSLPLPTVDQVRADPGVAWAAPVRTAYVILQLHGRKVPAYVVGSVPGQRGGPWSSASGRPPRSDDEITVGTVLARRHGIGVGDRLELLGRSFRVVGLSDSNGFMLSYVFVTHDALDGLAGSPGRTSFVLAGAADAGGATARLRAQGLDTLGRHQVSVNNLRFATGILGSPVRLMVAVGLAAGTMIIALTAYTAVVERRREYGIVKAMGGTGRFLVGLAVAQTLTLAALGLGAGWLLFVAGRGVIDASRPQFAIVLTAGAAGRAVAAALGMALLAAVVPARRLAALEPAAAYRSAA